QLQVDDAGDAAFDQVRRVRLVDVRARQRFGRQILEREASADAGEHLATVDGRENVADAADQRIDDLVVEAVDRLNARHALQAAATVLSGNLPMSSATIASTTWSAFFLMSAATSRLARKPVTTISSILPSSFALSAACAAATCADPTSMAAEIEHRARFLFFIGSPFRP